MSQSNCASARRPRAWSLMRRLLLLLAFICPYVSKQAAASIIFDTTPSWNGASSLGQWGPQGINASATFGETFVAPDNDDYLQSFTFYLKGDQQLQPTITYQADVFAWKNQLRGGRSPQGAIGAALFTITDLKFTDNGTFQPVSIDTGGTKLTPGDGYVVLFTTSDPTSVADNAGTDPIFLFGDTQLAHVANDGGGGAAFDNNASYASLNAQSWDDGTDEGDLAWKAVFTATVPEPSSLILIAIGGSTLLLVARKRPQFVRPAGGGSFWLKLIGGAKFTFWSPFAAFIGDTTQMKRRATIRLSLVFALALGAAASASGATLYVSDYSPGSPNSWIDTVTPSGSVSTQDAVTSAGSIAVDSL